MSLDLSRSAGSPEPAPCTAGAARVLVVVVSRGEQARALDHTLASVLDQRDEPPDVVLVTPPGVTGVPAAQPRVRVLDDPGRGLAAALNAGLAAATAAHRYATWLGDGDVLLPGASATAAAVLDADARAVAAFGDCRYLAANGEYLFTAHAGGRATFRAGLGLGRPAPPATLLRLDAVALTGGYDETLGYALDLDLLLRLRRRGTFAPTGRTLAASQWITPAATAAQRAAVLAEARRVRRAQLPGAVGGFLEVVQPPPQLAVRLFGRRLPPSTLRAAAWAVPAHVVPGQVGRGEAAPGDLAAAGAAPGDLVPHGPGHDGCDHADLPGRAGV
jgi:hypothetical protein